MEILNVWNTIDRIFAILAAGAGALVIALVIEAAGY